MGYGSTPMASENRIELVSLIPSQEDKSMNLETPRILSIAREPRKIPAINKNTHSLLLGYFRSISSAPNMGLKLRILIDKTLRAKSRLPKSAFPNIRYLRQKPAHVKNQCIGTEKTLLFHWRGSRYV